MNQKRFSCIGVLIFLSFLILTGCSHTVVQKLANELTFSLDGILDLTISYDEDKLTFFESESDKLVVREYMTNNKKRYYAKVRDHDDSIKISEGNKPFLKNKFTRRIEIFIPASYQNNLKITTTDGDIDLSEKDLNLSALRVDSTSGRIQICSAKAEEIYLSSTRGNLSLGNISADSIRLETNSGSVTCDKLDGSVSYTTTRGNADIKDANGFGSYRADNSGRLRVHYTNVTDDLSFFNKNGDIDLTLPSDLQFEFEAATKNGTITTSFQERVAVKGNTIKGTVGSSPTATITIETKNGNIKVMQ